MALLDLSDAFNHNKLLDRLENWVGHSGIVLKGFMLY